MQLRYRILWSDAELELYLIEDYMTGAVAFTKKMQLRASLVAQWLRIHLPMQGTRVRALVWEDPTCGRATKLVHHNY